jgi:hypothetical protein
MQLNELNVLSSTRSQRAALRSTWYGARSQLLTACANIKTMEHTVQRLRHEGFGDRAEMIMASPRYVTLRSAVETVAIRAISISTAAESLGIALETDFAPMIGSGKTKAQLAAAAEASGVAVEKLVEMETRALKARFDREMEAELDAAASFYSATSDEEIPLKTETILKAVERERDRMLEWGNLDLGELTLMKTDIDILTRLVDEESNEVEQSEGSHDDNVAESMAPRPSLSAIFEQYKNEIAALRGDKPKRVRSRAPSTTVDASSEE